MRPCFGKGAVVEPGADRSERLLVHPRDPGLADADLLPLSLEAGEKPGGRIPFPGEHGEGSGAATESLRECLKKAEVATGEEVLLPDRERVFDPTLLAGNHRQRA